MAGALQIARFLNKTLRVRAFSDSSKNGLQFNGKKEVRKIGFAVDSCLSVFEKAAREKCGMIIVHHGLIWKGDSFRSIADKRMSFLKKKGISLYGVHLPLDADRKYGNNIMLSNLLGIKRIRRFGVYKRQRIGFMGEFEKPISLAKAVKIIEKSLKTRCKVLKFGKSSLKTIGIISGGGSSMLIQAIDKKLDAYLTGELDL
ncbi:MAG: Nif3-like dinuclear metal center hexameric protein, partial [Candidatus Woesearchaeota archaeon]|nr:Nif3-like dinuclear metal center hexameric protein [Candidatus Woesearchaeota archaeon]